jgi:type II secretory pathway pseudopilin PulG
MGIHKTFSRCERGMTLVEIIMIILILGVVIVPLTQLSRANLKGLAGYSIMEKAQYDIQSVMERVISDYKATPTKYDSVKTAWNNRTGTTNSGQFNYSISFSADQVQNGVTYSVVTAQVSGGGLSENMVLTSWISKP